MAKLRLNDTEALVRLPPKAQGLVVSGDGALGANPSYIGRAQTYRGYPREANAGHERLFAATRLGRRPQDD